MAIVNNGIKVKLPVKQLPVGYVLPSVTEFSDFEYERELTLSVLKATVEDASAVTTLTNIIDDAAVGLIKQISDILAADYLGTASVTAFAELIELKSNISSNSESSSFFVNTPVSYVCKLKLYVKAA